jgi:hypothetical protein
MVPMLKVATDAFERLDGLGRAAASLDVQISRPVSVRDRLSGYGTLTADAYVGGELTVPGDDDETAALAARWARELGRGAGIELLEPSGNLAGSTE